MLNVKPPVSNISNLHQNKQFENFLISLQSKKSIRQIRAFSTKNNATKIRICVIRKDGNNDVNLSYHNLTYSLSDSVGETKVSMFFP